MTALLALAFAVAPSLAASGTLFVSPAGNDSADGSARRPLQTVHEAVRRLGARSGPGACEIRMASGTYVFTEPIRLGPKESGLPGEPVRFVPMPRAKVRWTTAISIPEALWKPVTDGKILARLTDDSIRRRIRQADLRALGVRSVSGPEPRGFPFSYSNPDAFLVRDGEPMRLAHWPNEGFAKIGEVVEGASKPGEPSPSDPTFRFSDARLRRWTGASDAWAYGYWCFDWADEAMPVRSIDADGGLITLVGKHPYGVQTGQGFRIENLIEELDDVSEFYFDRRRAIAYCLEPKGAIQAAVAAGSLVVANAWSHGTIEGIDIGPVRDPALSLSACRDVTVEGCSLQAIGGRGVVASGAVGVKIANCRFRHVGSGGVSLFGGDRKTLTPSNSVVTNCTFDDFSWREETYRPATYVGGCGIRVANNLMRNAPHSAIIFNGNDHMIELNRIENVIQRTGDGGAIYAGRDWTARGTVIRHNLIRNSIGIRKWENAIYLDDMLSGIRVEGNLILDCHWGMLIGGGRDCTIVDNLIVNCALGIQMDARGLGWGRQALGPIITRNFEAMPTSSEVWHRRFPGLKDLMSDDPFAPKGNVVTGNVLAKSGKITDRLEEPYAKLGRVEDNPSIEAAGIRVDDRGRMRWETDAEALKANPKLRSIPIDQIGPQPVR